MDLIPLEDLLSEGDLETIRENFRDATIASVEFLSSIASGNSLVKDEKRADVAQDILDRAGIVKKKSIDINQKVEVSLPAQAVLGALTGVMQMLGMEELENTSPLKDVTEKDQSLQENRPTSSPSLPDNTNSGIAIQGPPKTAHTEPETPQRYTDTKKDKKSHHGDICPLSEDSTAQSETPANKTSKTSAPIGINAQVLNRILNKGLASE